MKKFIFGLVIGLVLSLCLGTFAYSIAASDAEYDNTTSQIEATTVQEAIDNIYQRLDELSNYTFTKIATDTTTTSFNISQITDKYNELTSDNFIIIPKAKSITYSGSTSAKLGDYQTYYDGSASVTAASSSYNATTGVLTVTLPVLTTSARAYSYNNGTGYRGTNAPVPVDIYLLY